MAENYELKHQMPRPDLDDAPSDASDDAVDGPVDQVQLLRKLFSAAANGDETFIFEMLNRYKDLVDKKQNGETMLLVATREDNQDICRKLLNKFKADAKAVKDDNKMTPLHYAAQNANEEICKLLVNKGADINAAGGKDQMTPLHYAAQNANEGICKLLVNKGADINAAGGKDQRTPLHICAIHDHSEVLKYLLEFRRLKLNKLDGTKKTALMCAINERNKDCVKVFLTHKSWQKTLSVMTEGKNGKINTPMRQLIRLMPKMAMLVMTNCIELKSNDPTDPEFQATFNFQFLDDTYTSNTWSNDNATTDIVREKGKDVADAFIELPGICQEERERPSVPDYKIDINTKIRSFGVPGTCGTRCNDTIFNCTEKRCKIKPCVKPYTKNTRILKKNHPLMIMQESDEDLSDMICHPLSLALIKHKWNSIVVYFYISLFIYISFATIFTAAVLELEVTQNTSTAYSAEETTKSAYTEATRNTSTANSVEEIPKSNFALAIVLLTFAILLLLTEVYMMIAQRLRYFLVPANYLELFLYSSAITIALTTISEWTIDSDGIFCVAVIGVFFAWFNTLLRMRKVPFFGIYLIMFTKILRNSIVAILIFTPLLLAFSFSFSLLLGNMPLFRLKYVVASIFVMISGEMEYMDTVANKSSLNPGIRHKELVLAGYVVFIIIMVICLLNMLVGLAVSDVAKVYLKSLKEEMILKVDEVFYFEFDLQMAVRLPTVFLKKKLCEHLSKYSIRKNASCGCLSLKPNEIKDSDLLKRWTTNFEFNDSRLSAIALMRVKRKSAKNGRVNNLYQRSTVKNPLCEIPGNESVAVPDIGF